MCAGRTELLQQLFSVISCAKGWTKCSSCLSLYLCPPTHSRRKSHSYKQNLNTPSRPHPKIKLLIWQNKWAPLRLLPCQCECEMQMSAPHAFGGGFFFSKRCAVCQVDLTYKVVGGWKAVCMLPDKSLIVWPLFCFVFVFFSLHKNLNRLLKNKWMQNSQF